MAARMIGGDVRVVDPAEYDKDIPSVQEHLKRFERAVANVRRTHGGRSMEEIRQALLEEFDSMGLVVWSEVADDTARRIADGLMGDA
ncbi:hypothetical protein [Streptomyces sp. NPDC059564]|uniref:hypothetical protein n=1 Tax=Streptomyces sp. NPDC059564 TaxID=3346865 RepID=UPI00368118B7